MKNRPPTLTVSTQGLQSPPMSLPPGALGPSVPGSLRSRPLGARRRQPLNAGLFIANPDSSDDEDSQHGAANGTHSSSQYNMAHSNSNGSTHQVSPQRSFRSTSPSRNSPQHSSPHASPVGQASTIGRNAGVGTPLPPIPAQPSGSTSSGFSSLPSASSSVSPGAPPTMNTTSRPLPILNAPNPQPNPHHVGASNHSLSLGPMGSPMLSAFPMPSPSGHEMSVSLSQSSTCNGSTGHTPATASSSRPMPPQPPPQPERHRDFSQKPRAFTTPTMERDRGTIGDARVNSIYREQSGSPNRALPPLPPMKAQSVPSPTTGQLNQLHGSSPSNNPAQFHPPHHFPHAPPTPAGPPLTRVSSPDDALHVPDRRQRSNSMFKVLLQVTTDNEQFSIVDITGVQTAEAIRERIFSKLRFRDEDYATLSLFRTDIGESPEPTPLPNQNLLQLCQTLGDSRASLKFLVVQTGAPRSSSSMVPPPSVPPEHSSRGPPAIVTDIPVPPYTPDPHSGGHSKDGSLSSASGASMDRRQGSFHSISDAEDPAYYGARGTRQPTLSTSSASPIGGNSSRPSLHTNSSLGAVPMRVGSISTPDLRGPHDEAYSMALPSYPVNDSRDMGATIRASSTSAPQPPPAVAAFPTSQAGPSRSPPRSYSSASATLDIPGIDRATLDAMDEETKALVLQLAQEEQQTATRRQEQEMADAELALRTQQTEREHWQQEQERRQSEYDQVAADAAEAVRLQQEERLLEEQRHERMLEEQRQQEEERRNVARELPRDSEAERAHSVALERQMRRHLYQNQIATPGDYHSMPGPTAPLSYDRRRPSDSQAERPWVPSYPPSSPPDPNGHAYGRAPSYEAAVAQPLRPDGTGVRRPSNNMTSMPPYAHHAETHPRPTESRGSASRQGRYATYGPTVPRHNSSTTPVSVEFPSPHPSWPDPSPPISTSPDSSALRRASEANVSPPVNGLSHPGSYFPPSRSATDPRHRTPRHELAPRWAYSNDHYNREVELSDSVSTSGTVTSEAATIMPSEGTARPEDWQHRLEGMIGHHTGATRNPQSVLSSPDEATLFVPASRPQLTVNTTRGPPRSHSPLPTHYSVDSSDSESNNDEEGREWRQRSVNAMKRGGWRPDPEQLYDNLQDFFPKIDLDQPIVDPVVSSTPSTPNSESPRTTFEGRRPGSPEMVSAATHATLTGRSGSTPAKESEPTRMNPVRGAISAATAAIGGAFNRAENRKSIRNVAEHKKKSLLRNKEREREAQREAQVDRDQVILANAAAEERRIKRSSSMWGHRVVEVTPSRMSEIPAIPESPSGDGKPQTLNWVKGGLIGRGSYGRVYHALNVTTGDVMAVKQVEIPRTERDKNDNRHQTMVEALRKEQGLLQNLYHPNVVAYLGFEEGTKYLSIFLEYVPGGTIGSIYRTPEHGRFEENLIKFFTGQILQGLEYLHSNNVQHRDLKSDNILVDANGVCKISDFGISKRTSENAYESNLNTSMQGSVFWMAPEVMMKDQTRDAGRGSSSKSSSGSGRDDNTYSAKADIWSLGCVVVEMWTGQRPWGTMQMLPVMYASTLGHETPSIPPEILETMSPTAVQFLYDKCLCWESKGRPTAAELLKDPFVTERDPTWTWHNSRIGRAVAQKGLETIRNASYSTNGRAAKKSSGA